MNNRKNRGGSSTLNFISNLCAFFLTYSISFFLSPYIVRVLGADAYGYVTLATNFTNYISLATVALNSLASRFVSVAIYEKDFVKAQRYYSSVVIANALISLILIIPSTFFIIRLETFITIPEHLIIDVKILFAVIFSNFFISLLTSLFSVAVFVENKLYLTARHNAESGIIRLALTILLFMLFPAHIYFVGITSVIVNIYLICWNKRYMTMFLPKMKVKLQDFEFRKVFELIKSGSWGLLSQLSGILNNGFDLLLANEFINPVAMGVLSISSTLPAIIQSILSSVSSAFTPNFTKYYASKQFDKLTDELKKSIRLMSVVLIVPMAGLTIFGGDFYHLWQPTQNPIDLQVLSILKILCLIFTGSMAAVHEIFIVANKLKAQALATFISGIANIAIVYIFLKFNPASGIYAIAGVSSVIAILRNVVFTFPYAAKCINQKWYTFYGLSLQSFGAYTLNCLFFELVRVLIFVPITWGQFIVEVLISGVIGFVMTFLLVLKKEERKNLKAKITFRLKHKKD